LQATTSDPLQLYSFSDAQITAVLAHAGLKWEVIAEGSAQRKGDLGPSRLNRDLATILAHYRNDAPQ
jgi:hypothetical protein